MEKIENLEDLIRVLVSKNIPKIFLEGFRETKKCVEDKGWSTSPKNIYTSTSHYDDEFFKFWMASKIEKGTKINVFQHGGNYGHLEIYPNEKLEIENSNYFLTFGWNSKFQLSNSNHKNKIIPTSALNLGKNSFFSKQSGNIIIIVSLSTLM